MGSAVNGEDEQPVLEPGPLAEFRHRLWQLLILVTGILVGALLVAPFLPRARS